MAAEDRDDDMDSTEKSTFRCLDAARWVVAAAVMVVIVAVTAYAIKTVLRPGDLSIWVDGGSVAVERTDKSNLKKPFNASIGGDNLTFTYTIRAVNPSGRIRIYFTGIKARLRGRNSSASTNTPPDTFLLTNVPDMGVAPQSTMDAKLQGPDYMTLEAQKYYFEKLANGSSIEQAWLKLNGTRTVEIYSGHNLTAEQAIYYCLPLTVGGDQDVLSSTADALCTEKPPTGVS